VTFERLRCGGFATPPVAAGAGSQRQLPLRRPLQPRPPPLVAHTAAKGRPWRGGGDNGRRKGHRLPGSGAPSKPAQAAKEPGRHNHVHRQGWCLQDPLSVGPPGTVTIPKPGTRSTSLQIHALMSGPLVGT
jgi:hypothetical protein